MRERDYTMSIVEEYRIGMRDFRNCDLTDDNLIGADLRGVDLRGAYLREADLRGADLRISDLSNANLIGANLSNTNLRSANLRGADLRGADLRGADLSNSDLTGANLIRADLRDANLNISSHDIISYILLSDSGEDVEKRMLAGLVFVSRDWCWTDFAHILKERKDLRDFACEVLSRWKCFESGIRIINPEWKEVRENVNTNKAQVES